MSADSKAVDLRMIVERWLDRVCSVCRAELFVSFLKLIRNWLEKWIWFAAHFLFQNFSVRLTGEVLFWDNAKVLLYDVRIWEKVSLSSVHLHLRGKNEVKNKVDFIPHFGVSKSDVFTRSLRRSRCHSAWISHSTFLSLQATWFGLLQPSAFYLLVLVEHLELCCERGRKQSTLNVTFISVKPMAAISLLDDGVGCADWRHFYYILNGFFLGSTDVLYGINC